MFIFVIFISSVTVHHDLIIFLFVPHLFPCASLLQSMHGELQVNGAAGSGGAGPAPREASSPPLLVKSADTQDLFSNLLQGAVGERRRKTCHPESQALLLPH
jgi:hypothetical protein